MNILVKDKEGLLFSDAIYLNRQEITQLYNTDLSDQPYPELYRYLFVLACLRGLRFSDLANIQCLFSHLS